MSSPANDYLTKQLFIEKHVVTFRSLSRALGIHVNLAKNELAAYHAASQTPQVSFATYLVTGEVKLQHTQNSGTDGDVDMEYEEEDYSEEEVPLVKCVLVGETEVEAVKAQFTRVQSIYVYSLSPSPIRDAALICAPTEWLRQKDNEGGAELALVVGRIVAPNVQMGEASVVPPVAGASKLKPVPTVTSKERDLRAKGGVAEKDKVDAKGKAKETEPVKKEKPLVKSKATGKLDWSNAKAKEMKKEGSKEDAGAKTTLSSKKDKVCDKNQKKEEPKRGIKRKSEASALSDTDDHSGTGRGASSSTQSRPISRASSVHSKPKTGARVKKGVVLSDDDDPPQSLSRRKGRSSTGSRMESEVDSEDERSLKAMMDVDDDQVMRVARAAPTVAQKEEEEESTDQDVHMSDDLDPAPKPQRKKKVKKVIPIGRNGLKKKRIVKSRMTNDDKGYTVIEDYSEYESVDEESEPEKSVIKGKKKSGAMTDTADSTNEGAFKSKHVATKDSMKKDQGGKSSKGQAGGKNVVKGRGSLANFFGTPKPKK